MHDSAHPACGISLRTLFPEAVIFGADDIVVRACSADSRTVQAGDLFAAIVGPNCDGHDFVYEAAFRGASAILAERYVTADTLPVCGWRYAGGVGPPGPRAGRKSQPTAQGDRRDGHRREDDHGRFDR